METKTKSKPLKHFINGEWVEAESGTIFDVMNPLDDSLYAHAAKGTEDDILKAVSAAKSAFPEYRETLPSERERMLLRIAEIMEERKSELVDCLIDEIGSPIQKAMFEFTKGLTMLRAAAGLCRNVRGETIPSDAPGKFSMSIREPLGVVAAITPFNVPLIKTTRLVANALSLGNTVVHLPSELAPHLTVLFAEIVADAGFPAGAYNVVTGYGPTAGLPLAKNKDVKIILSSILPANAFPWNDAIENVSSTIISINSLMKDYALNNGIVYLDYHSSMVDENEGLNSDYTEDGVHPNKEGYKVMSGLAEKTISQI